MELRIDRIGPRPPVMAPLPDLAEADVVLATAQRARPVAGGERRRLVQEEELREAARPKERSAVPALELEPARDPPARRVARPDPASVVVDAAAVPVDEPAGLDGDDLPERRDAILQRHASNASHAQGDLRMLAPI